MAAPAWLDELALGPGPPWLAMGTRSLDLEGWLIADEEREADLATKAALLDARHDDVFRAIDTEAVATASAEVLALVAAATGGAPCGPGLHPLDAAGRLVQEDLCLLIRRDGAWHLDAASVCFPSYWRLDAKIGRPIGTVHEPVAHYAEELGTRVERFIDRLRPDGAAWRRNWSIHDDPSHFLPDPTPARRVDPPSDLWLRSERQTLRGLTSTRAVLFTIRTQQVPLAVLVERPDTARRMAAAIDAWSPELRAYKGRHGALRARGWLATVGS